jgi:hypothetical protein
MSRLKGLRKARVEDAFKPAPGETAKKIVNAVSGGV